MFIQDLRIGCIAIIKALSFTIVPLLSEMGFFNSQNDANVLHSVIKLLMNKRRNECNSLLYLIECGCFCVFVFMFCLFVCLFVLLLVSFYFICFCLWFFVGVLYAPSNRQNSTYHILCYTSRGALAGKRNDSTSPP